MVYGDNKYAWMHDPLFLDGITKMQAASEKFSEQMKQSFTEAKRQHTEVLHMGHETIQTLIKQEQNLLQEAQHLQQVKAQEKQEIESLKVKLSELKLKEDSLPEVLESYQHQVRINKHELDTKKQELHEKEHQLKQKTERATMGIDYYRSRFGLHFEKTSDSGIRVIFVNVDPKDHDRKFSFTLEVDSEDYKLIECKPHLSNLQPLVDELNKSNNISRFVVQMRKKFQEKCCND